MFIKGVLKDKVSAQGFSPVSFPFIVRWIHLLQRWEKQRLSYEAHVLLWYFHSRTAKVRKKISSRQLLTTAYDGVHANEYSICYSSYCMYFFICVHLYITTLSFWLPVFTMWLVGSGNKTCMKLVGIPPPQHDKEWKRKLDCDFERCWLKQT